MDWPRPLRVLWRTDGSTLHEQSIKPNRNANAPRPRAFQLSAAFLVLIVQKKRHKAYTAPQTHMTTRKKNEITPSIPMDSIKVYIFRSFRIFSITVLEFEERVI